MCYALPEGTTHSPRAPWNSSASADEISCSRCGGAIDCENDKVHELTVEVNDGRQLKPARTLKLCSDCVEMCAFCNEYLNDEVIEDMSLGPWVRVREWASDGQRVSMHAECAADHHMQTVGGDRFLYVSDLSREQISALVGGVA